MGNDLYMALSAGTNMCEGSPLLPFRTEYRQVLLTCPIPISTLLPRRYPTFKLNNHPPMAQLLINS